MSEQWTASSMGKKGGSVSSRAKARAARKNAKGAGRPPLNFRLAVQHIAENGEADGPDFTWTKAIETIEQAVAVYCETDTDGLQEWLGGPGRCYTGKETPKGLATKWDKLGE